MRISDAIATLRPFFSFEFFPPKDDDGSRRLFAAIAALQPLRPAFVSITYGAGGSTRARTVALAKQIQAEIGLTVVAHVTCVGSTRADLRALFDDLARAGYQPFHSPCGILLDEGNRPFSRCIRCIDCDGFPCLVHAKSDAEVIAVRPALQFPNVTLLTKARATQLRTNAAGTAVTEVVVDHDGTPEIYRGGIVVVSCGAANSARLLLASANDQLYEKLKSMLSHLGMHPDHLLPRNLYLKSDMGLSAVGHQAGTCRFGTDPATSVRT